LKASEQIEALELRMVRLERQNRLFKRIVFGMLAVPVLGLALAFGGSKNGPQPNVITAERFEVVIAGKTAAVIGATDEGGYLSIFNKDRQIVAELSANPDGSGLRIRTKDGKIGAALEADQNGGNLGIFNRDHLGVAALRAGPGGGRFSIFDLNHQIVAELEARPYGGGLNISAKNGKSAADLFVGLAGGALNVKNKDGKTVAGFYDDLSDGGRMEVYDKEGKTVQGVFSATQEGCAWLGLLRNEKPVLRLAFSSQGGIIDLWNKDEKRSAALSAGKDGGSVLLLAPDGHVLFHAP
jgi:hypothetical protein